MSPADQAAAVLAATTDLNTSVRDALDTITVAEARQVIDILREAKGWMDGIAKLLTLDHTATADLLAGMLAHTEKPGPA